MSNGYVILEVGYEYNDEIYHSGYNGDSYEAPKEVFTDKEKAKAEMVLRTNKHLRGLSLGHYCYGLDEITHREEDLIKFFNDEFSVDLSGDDYYEMDVPTSATDGQLAKLQELIHLKFFKLQEVELV